MWKTLARKLPGGKGIPAPAGLHDAGPEGCHPFPRRCPVAKKPVPRLRKGAKAKTKKGMAANYQHMRAKGKPRKQAIAVMLSMAGKSKKK
jgi:hypothetical protein